MPALELQSEGNVLEACRIALRDLPTTRSSNNRLHSSPKSKARGK